jgi:hypothetical protein
MSSGMLRSAVTSVVPEYSCDHVFSSTVDILDCTRFSKRREQIWQPETPQFNENKIPQASYCWYLRGREQYRNGENYIIKIFITCDLTNSKKIKTR